MERGSPAEMNIRRDRRGRERLDEASGDWGSDERCRGSRPKMPFVKEDPIFIPNDRFLD